MANRRGYDRTDRLRSLLLEILAEQLESVEDPALEFVFFSAVQVDKDLNRAQVYFSSLDLGALGGGGGTAGGGAAGGGTGGGVGAAGAGGGAAGTDGGAAGGGALANQDRPDRATEIARALSSHSRTFRRALAKQAHLRRIPELVFVSDDSFRHGAHIEEVLRDLK